MYYVKAVKLKDPPPSFLSSFLCILPTTFKVHCTKIPGRPSGPFTFSPVQPESAFGLNGLFR